MAPLAIDCLPTTVATSSTTNRSSNKEEKGFFSKAASKEEELQSLRLRMPDFKLLSDLMILGPMETNLNEGKEEGDKLGEILQGLTDVNHACLQQRQAQVQLDFEFK